MSCPLDDIHGDITLIMPNVIEFSNSADSVNLFAVHNKSDAVNFTYTATNGTQKDFKFPLTGFNEKYLAYIIHSGFISGYQNRYGDNLKPPTNVYHRMTA